MKRKLTKLESLFQLAAVASDDDIEMMSHWAKYLCVLCSGFFENAVLEIYGEFAKKAPEPVSNFVYSTLEGVQNPKTDRFIEIAGKFKESWATELAAFIEENNGERKAAINSIISIRHLVAHGKDTGITIARLKEYLDRSVEVVEFIEAQTLA